MAGAAMVVYLRYALSDDQFIGIRRWLRSISTDLTKRERSFHFYARNHTIVDIASEGEQVGCEFAMYVDDPEFDDLEAVAMLERLGYVPQGHITLTAGCNQRVDEAILAQITLHCAEACQGLICLGSYDLDLALRDALDGCRSAVPPSGLARARLVAHGLSGTAVEIPHLTEHGGEDAHFLVDARFFRSWLSVPTRHLLE